MGPKWGPHVMPWGQLECQTSCFVAVFDCLDILYVPKMFGRAKNAHKRATVTKDVAKR